MRVCILLVLMVSAVLTLPRPAQAMTAEAFLDGSQNMTVGSPELATFRA